MVIKMEKENINLLMAIYMKDIFMRVKDKVMVITNGKMVTFIKEIGIWIK